MICFTSLSQIFVLTYSSSLAFARLHSYVKFAEPPKGGSSPTQLHDKRDVNISQHLFYGVVRVTKVEPDDIYNLSYFDNVVNLIHLLKNSTEDYYNMKKVVGW